MAACFRQRDGVNTNTGDVNFHPLKRRIKGKKKNGRALPLGTKASLHPLLDGRDPESGLRPRDLPRLAFPPALKRQSSRPAFRWCLLGSSSSFPNTGDSTAGLITRMLTCPSAAPKIACPGTPNLRTHKARTWPGKAKPAERASVSLLLGRSKTKHLTRPAPPVYHKSRCRAQRPTGPRSAPPKRPPTLRLPRGDGGQCQGWKTQGWRLRLGVGSSEQARALPG